MTDEKRRQRLLYLMRRLLRGTTTSSKHMSRAEYETLRALGFPVQGEQAWGDMAGSGCTYYFIEPEDMEKARRVYEQFSGGAPLTEPTPRRPSKPRFTEYACVICDRAFWTRRRPPVVVHEAPVCPDCAREVAEKWQAGETFFPNAPEEEEYPPLAEMIADVTWRGEVHEHWMGTGLAVTAPLLRHALLERGVESTLTEAAAVWLWYARTHLGREEMVANEEEARQAVDAFLEAWQERPRRVVLEFLWLR